MDAQWTAARWNDGWPEPHPGHLIVRRARGTPRSRPLAVPDRPIRARGTAQKRAVVRFITALRSDPIHKQFDGPRAHPAMPQCSGFPILPMGVTTRMPFRSLPISGFSGFPRKRQGRISTAQRAAQFSHPVRKAPASPLLRPLVGGGNGFRKLPQGADLPPSPGKPVPGRGLSGPERLDILPTPQCKAGGTKLRGPVGRVLPIPAIARRSSLPAQAAATDGRHTLPPADDRTIASPHGWRQPWQPSRVRRRVGTASEGKRHDEVCPIFFTLVHLAFGFRPTAATTSGSTVPTMENGLSFRTASSTPPLISAWVSQREPPSSMTKPKIT